MFMVKKRTVKHPHPRRVRYPAQLSATVGYVTLVIAWLMMWPLTESWQGAKHMPIAVNFVSSRRKKITVDVVPAEWQLYIAQ